MRRVALKQYGMLAVITIAGSANAQMVTHHSMGRSAWVEGAVLQARKVPDLASLDGSFKEPAGDLTIQSASAAALLNSPKLAQFAWEIRASEARLLQQKLLPNPKLDADIEEYRGSGNAFNDKKTESTLVFSQLLELGGKRQNRTRVASLDVKSEEWGFEAARLAVLSDVSRAFLDVLALQERQSVAKQNLKLAQKVFDAVAVRVQAGVSSPLDESKAKITLAQEVIVLDRIKQELGSARAILASTWGGEAPLFERVNGHFSALRSLPKYDELTTFTKQNPNLIRSSVEIKKRLAQVKYQRSKAIPNVTVGFGMKQQREIDDVTAVVQFSMPLMIFDRNQGGIQEAIYDVENARQKNREIDIQLGTELTSAYKNLSAALYEVKVLEDELLPASTQIFNSINIAYREGKVDFLEVLDAQRTLFGLRGQLVMALESFNHSRIDVEELIGLPLSEISN